MHGFDTFPRGLWGGLCLPFDPSLSDDAFERWLV